MGEKDRMSRRSVVGLAVAILATSPGNTLARQEATPSTEPRYVSDFLNLEGVEEAAGLVATLPNPSFDVLEAGALYYVWAWGLLFNNQANATVAGEAFAHAYRDTMREVRKLWVTPLEEASVRPLGDESRAWVAKFVNPVDPQRSFPWALVAVRTDTSVQILEGASATGNVVTRLADIAEPTLDRWPNNDRRDFNDDQTIGGVWNILPDLRELEEGMVIDNIQDLTFALN